MDAPNLELKIEKRQIKRKAAYHHGDLAQSIINSVAKLIEKYHSVDFQLKEVAAMVNTSVPAIYRHFESKQALLVETAIQGYRIQKKFRDFALQKCSDTSLHKLIAIGFAYVAFSREFPGFFMLMKNLETAEILSSKTYVKQRDVTVDTVNSTYLQAVKDGYLKDGDMEVALTFLQSASLGLATMYMVNSIEFFAPRLKNDKFLIEQVYKTAISGLLTEKGHSIIDDALKNPFGNIGGDNG